MSSITNYLKLFQQEIEFVAGAANPSQLPNFRLPQIAFVGKSNVGKSSLINAVCSRRHLARVSHTPGRTQQINFFEVAKKFILVDLPGYGYAKVSHKQQENWEKLITHYLFKKNSLELVNVLIDSRRGIKEHDLSVIDLLLDNDLNIQIVFTKADEIKNHEELKSNTCDFLKNRYNKDIPIYFTSARSKEGAKELQISFYKYLRANAQSQ